MSNWIQHEEAWFNLENFTYIWIEPRICNEYVIGYYLMGEFVSSNGRVVLTSEFKTKQALIDWFNLKIGNKD